MALALEYIEAMQDETAEDNASKPESPLFEATLYPHRSLPPGGFWLLMAAVAGVSFTVGLMFAAAGAWPIMGFFGIDVLLFYIAFRFSYRSGRLIETVRLTRDELLVRRIHPNGRVDEWRLQPYWLRIDAVPTLEEIGAPTAEVRLSSHGRHLGIGRFLTDDERDDFSQALGDALRRCRGLPAPDEEFT